MRVIRKIINFLIGRRCSDCDHFWIPCEMLRKWEGGCFRIKSGWVVSRRPSDTACEKFEKAKYENNS